MIKNLPVLSVEQRAQSNPKLLDPVENRKSGLSLNHVLGCPLNCSYCVRHLYQNFDMKDPHLLMSDEDAVSALLMHRLFRRGSTPIQIFNRATDPFLPGVKKHTFRVLELLAEHGLTNHVLLITRFHVTKEDAARLNEFSPLRVTLLVTYSGLADRRVEPLGSKPAIRSLLTTSERALTYRTVLYWRPLIQGMNDSDAHIHKALDLSKYAHATVFTGLFYRDAMQAHYVSEGLPEPYERTERRKILTRETENRILRIHSQISSAGALFRKTSCAVAYAHQVADYNGHFGISAICDICPTEQQTRCETSLKIPNPGEVSVLATHVGAETPFQIYEDAVVFEALDESQRYYIQHALGFQIHDARYPHRPRRHGRAEIGWEVEDDD